MNYGLRSLLNFMSYLLSLAGECGVWAKVLSNTFSRLRVVSNFDNSGEIHARARGLPRGDSSRGEVPLVGAHFCARTCISPESPKLETTQSLYF